MTEEQQFPQQKETASQGAVCASSQKAPPRRKKRLRALLAVLLALVVAAVGFTAGWLGNEYSSDPRLRELEWMLDLLEDEHYKDVDMDAVYEEIYDAVMPDIFSTYYTQ